MKKQVYFGAMIGLAVTLAACGGGSGGSGGGGLPPTPTPTNTPVSNTTTATGKVVDRDTNAPLGGVKVGLASWTAGATPAPEGTTAPDGSFSFTAPNGKYLLVIGSDSPSDTTRPTIHDTVTLTGGSQTLHAPTLPPVPAITPPPSETSGNYRLATIEANYELPCFQAFNQQRTQRGLPLLVADEWLTENTREAVQYATGPNFNPSNALPVPALTTGNELVSGGSSCLSGLAIPAFSNAAQYAADPRTLWFGGSYIPYGAPGNYGSAQGLAEFPIDPRGFTDPNHPNWP